MSDSAERPWIVKTPFGTVWVVRFKTEQAAWRRVIRPNFGNGYGNPDRVLAQIDEYKKRGWTVKRVTH